MARRLPRYDAERQAAEQRRLEKILREIGEPEPSQPIRGVPSGSDSQRLRGLPAIGRNVTGAVPGTNPLGALLAKESRRRR